MMTSNPSIKHWQYSHKQIEMVLAEKLERAEAVWRWEKGTFAAFVAELPSGLPHLEAVERIKSAADRYNHALEIAMEMSARGKHAKPNIEDAPMRTP